MKEKVNLVHAPITSFVSLSVPVCLSVSVLLVFHVLLSACLYDIYIAARPVAASRQCSCRNVDILFYAGIIAQSLAHDLTACG